MSEATEFEQVGRKRRRRRRRKTNLRAESTYVPNLLTYGRIACIPFVLYFIDNYSPVRSFIAMLIYVGAAITDSLDGYIARKYKQISVLGKFLDPLADKLIVTSVLVYLTAMDRCPAWLVVALLAREFAVTGLRSITTTEGLVISASDSGKQKTALQLIGTIFLLIHFKYPLWGMESILIDFHGVGIVTLYLALAMSWISALDYFLKFVRAVQSSDKPPEKPPEKSTDKPPQKPAEKPNDPGPRAGA